MDLLRRDNPIKDICALMGVSRAGYYKWKNREPSPREINGALMAAKSTGCNNLLLLTDHNYEEIEQDGFHIKVQPVYDWSLSM